MSREARFREFEGRQMALIAEFADILSPKDCEICERDRGCPHDVSTAVDTPGVMPADFMLIHRWSRLDGAGGYWDWLTSESLLMVESIGLLQVVTDNARDRVRG